MAGVLAVLIIGGGAAGYTAGIFAARDRCRALLLEKFSAGGQVLNCEHITNFPGFPQGVAGYTLGPPRRRPPAGRDRRRKPRDPHPDRRERLALHHPRGPGRG